MIKNDCWTCPFRKDVPGSVHVQCRNPVILPDHPGWFEKANNLQRPLIENKNDGSVILSVDEHGFVNGWAFFPFNFDPIWITCKLPIDETLLSSGE